MKTLTQTHAAASDPVVSLNSYMALNKAYRDLQRVEHPGLQARAFSGAFRTLEAFVLPHLGEYQNTPHLVSKYSVAHESALGRKLLQEAVNKALKFQALTENTASNTQPQLKNCPEKICSPWTWKITKP